MISITRRCATFALVFSGVGLWNLQESGTKARFRGVSVVSDQVAWASGSQSTCLRTTDGGLSWKRLVVPDAEGLDFRDVHAFDEKSACLLSIGSGELSRIYRTEDGGATWTLRHRNTDPNGFLDAIAFWNGSSGIALGDPVDGRFVILRTSDGGHSWTKIPDSGMPLALPGEGAFAASGTCLITSGKDHAWFGTGGGKAARIFRSEDGGKTWAVSETPLRAGIASAGVFSIAFRDSLHGLAVGGDYKSPEDPTGNFAITTDGGVTWNVPPTKFPAGFRSAVAYAPLRAGVALAVGPSGSDVSTDGGLSWTRMDGSGWHALGFDRSGLAGWAVGEDGRIARFDPAFLQTPGR